jgi:hypothetical protein
VKREADAWSVGRASYRDDQRYFRDHVPEAKFSINDIHTSQQEMKAFRSVIAAKLQNPAGSIHHTDYSSKAIWCQRGKARTLPEES